MSELPMHGPDRPDTLLAPPDAEAAAALQAALAADDHATLGQRLRAVAADHPGFPDAWGRLARWALDAADPVAAYAFARTGYHRGLDAVRKAGWGGQGPVPWRHEPNRGFLRSVEALMRAAEAIGETDEATRCRRFLLELDPDDTLGVAGTDPSRQ